MDFYLLALLGIFLFIAFMAAWFGIKLFKTKVPFIPTPDAVCDQMIDLANIQPGMKVVDLGSGNGKLLFRVLKKEVFCKGYELVRPLIWWSNMRRSFIPTRVRTRVEFFCQDFFTVDHSEANVIFCYLWPSLMDRFLNEIYPTLKPETKIISHAFRIHGLKEVEMREVGKTKVWLYIK